MVDDNTNIESVNPFSPAYRYYTQETDETVKAAIRRNRTLSTAQTYLNILPTTNYNRSIRRRASHDETHTVPRRFLVDVDKTLEVLLRNEDTDGNMQITIEDSGPKVLTLGTVNSNGINHFDIRGTYMLSNLLQELTLAKDYGRSYVLLDERRLNENPVSRLSRLIRETFWDDLTRRIDSNMLEIVCADTKSKGSKVPRIYVPHTEKETYEYYVAASKAKPHLGLVVEYLPAVITEEWVRDVNSKPGLLALAMEKYINNNGIEDLRGVPFIVPGGRFNEMYGWDSYFEALGLIIDGKIDIAKGMVENMSYEINHYGMILNANRSYYLCRSQPPFLTDMTLNVYDKINHKPGSLDFLKNAFQSAIKEYYTVWKSPPRFDPVTGLSRYRPSGLGIPPETEATHFICILEPYIKKYKMSFDEFQHAYNYQKICEPELDEYFLHDRAVRESGHDTSSRLEKNCANLATIDLNSLLYKYEIDIANVIKKYFNDRFVMPDGSIESSAIWIKRAVKRRAAIDKYLWNEEKGFYFDYETVNHFQSTYESATAFWALWAGCSSSKQAATLIEKNFKKFECLGGLVAGTKQSKESTKSKKANRQWDYPYGWAPQQILAWKGLMKYGYENEAKRLIYRWLYTVTKSFVDFNGIVVEKYNITNEVDPHRVNAEYGNQGVDIKGVAREGFGWVNASFSIGLTYCDTHMIRALGTCTHPKIFFKNGKYPNKFKNV